MVIKSSVYRSEFPSISCADSAGSLERLVAPTSVSARETDIATSDLKEIERWFLELYAPLYRYLRAAGCRHPLAEEITQETFLRLHGALDSGLGIGDIRAWVFRVARNLSIDSRRLDDRHWELGELQYPADAPDPERQAIDRQQQQRIADEVSRLPGLQRECVSLKAHGFRYREIAAALNISTSAAVDYVRRARKKLGKLVR